MPVPLSRSPFITDTTNSLSGDAAAQQSVLTAQSHSSRLEQVSQDIRDLFLYNSEESSSNQDSTESGDNDSESNANIQFFRIRRVVNEAVETIKESCSNNSSTSTQEFVNRISTQLTGNPIQNLPSDFPLTELKSCLQLLESVSNYDRAVSKCQSQLSMSCNTDSAALGDRNQLLESLSGLLQSYEQMEEFFLPNFNPQSKAVFSQKHGKALRLSSSHFLPGKRESASAVVGAGLDKLQELNLEFSVTTGDSMEFTAGDITAQNNVVTVQDQKKQETNALDHFAWRFRSVAKKFGVLDLDKCIEKAKEKVKNGKIVLLGDSPPGTELPAAESSMEFTFNPSASQQIGAGNFGQPEAEPANTPAAAVAAKRLLDVDRRLKHVDPNLLIKKKNSGNVSSGNGMNSLSPKTKPSRGGPTIGLPAPKIQENLLKISEEVSLSLRPPLPRKPGVVSSSSQSVSEAISAERSAISAERSPSTPKKSTLTSEQRRNLRQTLTSSLWRCVHVGDSAEYGKIRDTFAGNDLEQPNLLPTLKDAACHSALWDALAFRHAPLALEMLEDFRGKFDLTELHPRRKDTLLHLVVGCGGPNSVGGGAQQ